MGISFDYDFGTNDVLVHDAPKGSTVIVDGVKYVPERTCKLEKVHDWNDEWEPFGFVCGECEEALPRYYGSDNFGNVILPNYCPNCGAKVIGD